MSRVKVLWYCNECGKRHLLNHVGVGSAHRARMRLLHRHGLCAMHPLGVEPGRFRCEWCGMAGHKIDAKTLPGGKVKPS